MALSHEQAGKGVCGNAIARIHVNRQHQALQDDPERATAILRRIPVARVANRMTSRPIAFLASPASDYMSGHTMAVGYWMGR